MHTVITGGAGFIGSHLTDYLLAAGDTVTVLDDFSTGTMDNLVHNADNKRLFVFEGSVLTRRLVNEVILRADRVFHLAAAVGVKRILDEPLKSLRTNLHGTENVLEAALQANAIAVVASTSEIYGKNASDSLNEESDCIYGNPLLSRWSYATAKSIDEAFAHAYWREEGLQVSISRFFNTVGPRQTGRYGMVVPNLIGQALADKPLTVFGDGHQTRNFTYVGDIVPALVRLSEPGRAVMGQAFNLGGAQEISIFDLAERIIWLTNSKSTIRLVPYSEAYGEGYEDMRRRVPDVTKACRVLDFQPSTTLDDIIYEVAGYLKEKADVLA